MANSLLAKPHGAAGADIGCANLQYARIVIIGFVVKGEKLLWQISKNKIKAKYATLFYPVLQTKVPLVGDVVFDNLAGSQGLVGHVGEDVSGSGGDCGNVGKG